MLIRACYTQTPFLPPAVHSLKAESEDEVTFLHESHKLHLPNIHLYKVRLCKAKAELKPKLHLPKKEKKRVSPHCLPQDRPFKGCFEKETRRKCWIALEW